MKIVEKEFFQIGAETLINLADVTNVLCVNPASPGATNAYLVAVKVAGTEYAIRVDKETATWIVSELMK